MKSRPPPPYAYGQKKAPPAIPSEAKNETRLFQTLIRDKDMSNFNKNKDIGMFFLKLSYYIASLFAAADSGFILYIILKGNFTKFMLPENAHYTATFFTGCYILAVEGVLLFNLHSRIREYITRRKDGKDILWKGMIAYMVALSAITYGLSSYGRDHAAKSIVDVPTLIDKYAAKTSATSAANKTLDDLNKSKESLLAQIKTAEANVGNPKLWELKKSGNVWAQNEVKKLQTKATATLRTQLADTENLILATLGSISAAELSTEEAINKIDKIKTDNYLTSTETVSGIFNYIAMIAIAMMWVTAILRAIHDAAYGKLDGVIGTPPPTPPSGDDDEEDEETGEPRNDMPHHHRKRRTPPKVVYMDNESDSLHNELNNDESPVITRGADDGGTYFMTRYFKFYTNENNVIIRAENTQGKVLDRTQCLQYCNTYKNKARAAGKPETKRGNLLISSAFAHAVKDIDWSKTA